MAALHHVAQVRRLIANAETGAEEDRRERF
jgi:hypothetical protein